MDLKLVALSGGVEPDVVPIDAAELVIGRHASCRVRVDDPAISLRHCRIRRQGDVVTVEDLNSTSGTILNGRKVLRATVHHGDQLQVGPVRYQFSTGTEQAGPQSGPRDWVDEALDERNRPPVPTSEDDLRPESAAARSARDLLERMASAKAGRGGDEAGGERGDAAGAERSSSSVPLVNYPAARVRLRVGESRGVVVAQILPRSLVDEAEIDEVKRQLMGLIQAGHARLVVDCDRVKHVASQAIGTLLLAQRRCQQEGGQLKLVRVGAEIRQSLAVMVLSKFFEIQPDERTALEGAWPKPSSPQPSLAATLLVLRDYAGAAPPSIHPPGGAASRPVPPAQRSAPGTAAPVAERLPLRVRLIVLVGKAMGKSIEISRSSFYIGRDPRCHLRPDSPAISRIHTVIEQRDGRVFVRDHGTTNGTTVNDRLLRNAEVEVTADDRIEIGPLLFVIAIEPRAVAAATAEDDFVRLVLGEGKADADSPTLFLHPTSPHPADRAPPPGPEASS